MILFDFFEGESLTQKPKNFEWENIIKELKSFNWRKILEISNSLSMFNDAQWRFLKAFVIELSLEKYSNDHLKYVALKHKDYDWVKLNVTVELKSNTSCSMFGKKGKIKNNFTILLNNSMGTNNKQTLDNSEISDIIVVVYNDGVFAISKETAKKFLNKKGDGFSLLIPKEEITLIYKNSIKEKNDKILSLKDDIMKLIRSKI